MYVFVNNTWFAEIEKWKWCFYVYMLPAKYILVVINISQSNEISCFWEKNPEKTARENKNWAHTQKKRVGFFSFQSFHWYFCCCCCRFFPLETHQSINRLINVGDDDHVCCFLLVGIINSLPRFSTSRYFFQ